MTRILLIGLLFSLAACGIDGPPTPPGGGISTSGDAQVGVVGTL